MRQAELRVDNDAHVLHFDGHTFPCSRDVEAVQRWKENALLLSSDTDCLSLWDHEGLVRLARVGVYPQDVVVMGDRAIVCGGASGRLHMLTLPDLLLQAEYPVPGMPERLCLCGEAACVLTLMPEPEVHTMLLAMDMIDGQWREIRRLSGIPESITADEAGLWIATSDGMLHMPNEELRI